MWEVLLNNLLTTLVTLVTSLHAGYRIAYSQKVSKSHQPPGPPAQSTGNHWSRRSGSQCSWPGTNGSAYVGNCRQKMSDLIKRYANYISNEESKLFLKDAQIQSLRQLPKSVLNVAQWSGSMEPRLVQSSQVNGDLSGSLLLPTKPLNETRKTGWVFQKSPKKTQGRICLCEWHWLSGCQV